MPAPPPPPPPTFNLGGGSAEQGRGALLQSIRAGKPLKKTVTVDKSAPVISGKVQGDGPSAPSTNTRSPAPNTNSINNGNPMGLGGLFSGGMPKLKPTGMRNNLAERDNGNVSPNTSSATLPSVKRGPPPVPPPAAQKPQIFSPSVQPTTEPSVNHNADTPRSSFGKPTLAPKPPSTSSSGTQQKPSPPPKKLSLAPSNPVSRAQSMRVPRSPAVLAPTPPSLHQSQDCLNEPQQRPTINRVLRPPAARPPSPPSTRPGMASSNGAPPIARVAPLPPCRAPSIPPPPPPLPHRSSSSSTPGPPPPPPSQQPQTRVAPPVPPPPTPPTRGQSLQQQHRNGQTMAEFEARFADMFHSIATFPSPEPYRNVPKVYNSRTAAKAQAPAPPQRSVSNVGSNVGVRQPPRQPQQQWQQHLSNAASSAC